MLFCAVVSLFVGVQDISFSDFMNLTDDQRMTLGISRIPRTISLIMVGMGMSIAGFIMQQISQNKFVSPSTAGTQKPVDFELVWIHNSQPEKGSELSSAARLISIPEEVSKFAYVAAEFSTVKDLRNYFRKELGWNREELYAYSYWKSGVAEDRSVSERQAEKKSME